MTRFTTRVFLFPSRASLEAAFEVLEPDDGKPSCPVLRGLGPSNGARLPDQRLTGLMRPTPGHIPTSRYCRLYGMPSLCWCA